MTTTYCTHPYDPRWQVDADGLGQLVCIRCGAPLTPKQTPPVRTAELALMFGLLLVSLVGAALWFWWTWLA